MASRASKNLIYRAIGGVKNYFKRQNALTQLAKDRMDKKYPGGWSDSSEHMAELSQMRKDIRKGLGK